MRPPLVLTGPAAVGKSTCARRLARQRARAACIDVDDVRQLVVTGAAAPWDGAAGRAQLLLGARNACALGRNLTEAGFEVVIADVITPATAAAYREELPGCLLVRLQISFDGARERAATRPVFITDEEFAWVFALDAVDPPAADVVLHVDGWDLDRQVAALAGIWAADPAAR
jgi:predicted kinase